MDDDQSLVEFELEMEARSVFLSFFVYTFTTENLDEWNLWLEMLLK